MSPSNPPGGKRRRSHPVTVDEITETALALLDEHGLDRLTMRRLAGAIGVEPMTLYRYLPNKEAILAVVAERLWQQLPPTPETHDDWQARVRAMWLSLYDLMVAHPHAVPLVARAGTYSVTALEGTADMLSTLREAGFDADAMSEFLHAAGALVVGFAYADHWSRLERAGDGPASPAGQPGRDTASVMAPLSEIRPWQRDHFTTALDLIIEGFAARLLADAGPREVR